MHDFSIFDKEETVCRKAEETLGYFQPFFTTVAPGSAAGPTHTRNADLHSPTNSSSILPLEPQAHSLSVQQSAIYRTSFAMYSTFEGRKVTHIISAKSQDHLMDSQLYFLIRNLPVVPSVFD